MLKRTLFFANPCRLSVKDKQMQIKMRENEISKTVPIEDIGFVVLESQQISISMPLLDELTNNNVAVIFCGYNHLPNAMLLSLNGHHLQNEIFRIQLDASVPLKKNLWKQTIERKIKNQAALLKKLNKKHEHILHFSKNVKSGDSDNRESAAARAYWSLLFGKRFLRERYGSPPNNMLNYAYAVLRAAVARALSGSGLLLTLGIHHHNKYNAFCLADDIIEPYRPFVDEMVYDIYTNHQDIEELTTEIKAELLQILTVDTVMDKTKRPLMIALSQSSASLVKCFSGESKMINYPKLI